jgi:hypothetical protein
MNIGSLRSGFKQKWGRVQVSAFAPLLSDEEISQVCERLGHHGRESCRFPPPAVVRSMMYRGLHPDKSIRNVVEDLLAGQGLHGIEHMTESGWCQARGRLPEGLPPDLVRSSAGRAMDRFGADRRWRGREVRAVDGTTVSMPDHPKLVEAFGYTHSKNGRSRFPLARVAAILDAGTHVITDYRAAPYATSEVALFREMLPGLPKGAVWMGDDYFSSFLNFALSKGEGVDWVSRLHHCRDGRKLAKSGKRLGPNEWLVTLDRPEALPAEYAALDLPRHIVVRLIRVRYRHKGQEKTMWIVTSLLDAAAYPRQEIVELYHRRWGIETHYNHLKTTLGMAVLRSHRPENIESEIGAILLAHNLVWTLILEAVEGADIPVERISFAGAVQTVLAFSPYLRAAGPSQRADLYRRMLQRIARHRNPCRPGRHEPRMVKRDRKRYPTLKTSRQEARNAA